MLRTIVQVYEFQIENLLSMDSVLNSVSPVPGLLPNICRMRHLILCIRIGKDFLRKVLLALILKNDFDRNLGKLSLIHSSCIY